MTKKKKIAVGSLAIAAVALLAIGGTLSFLTDSEQVTNRFSMGDLDITIDEPHWNDDPTEPLEWPTDPSTGETIWPTDPDTGETVYPTEPLEWPTDPDTGETIWPTDPDTGETVYPTQPTEPLEWPTDPNTGETIWPTDPDTGETVYPTEPLEWPTDPNTGETIWPTDPDTGETVYPTEPDGPGDGDNLRPGDSRDKDPTITAIAGDSYMRIVMMIKDKDGSLITDPKRLELIFDTIHYAKDDAIKEGTPYSLADMKAYTTYNEEEYTFDEDRSKTGIYYYNYNGVFKKGSSAVLFSDVVIPIDWGRPELQLLGKYQIVLQAQAIQSTGFADSDAAFEAMDAEIEAGTFDRNYLTKDKDSDWQYDVAKRTILP